MLLAVAMVLFTNARCPHAAPLPPAKAARCAHRASWPPSAMSAPHTWYEDGVRCSLYRSGLIRFGHNAGWHESMHRVTKCSKGVPIASEAVRRHRDFSALAAHASGRATVHDTSGQTEARRSAGPHRELRSLNGGEVSAALEQRALTPPKLFIHSASSARNDYAARHRDSSTGSAVHDKHKAQEESERREAARRAPRAPFDGSRLYRAFELAQPGESIDDPDALREDAAHRAAATCSLADGSRNPTCAASQ